MNHSKYQSRKTEFLNQEIWLLSLLGGLGRSGVYSHAADEQLRRSFRTTLVEEISNAEQNYSQAVSSSAHIACIETIRCKLERDHKLILKCGYLPFGIVQKVINLRLKYLWCMGWCHEPPHFPVDRIMLTEIYGNNPPPWTKMNLEEYAAAISIAEAKATPQSLAEWELVVFNRRETSA